jgi:hypothetical protein
MPHVIAIVVAGAGLYAGLKWVSRQIATAEKTAARKAATSSRHAPKDLGALDRDPVSGVYRPRVE